MSLSSLYYVIRCLYAILGHMDVMKGSPNQDYPLYPFHSNFNTQDFEHRTILFPTWPR